MTSNNNPQKTREDALRQFLDNYNTPEDRLKFLESHTNRFRHALIRLRAAVEPTGWIPKNNYSEYRPQKERVRSIFQDIANEARELDKLRVFKLLDIDQMTGADSIVGMDGKIRHLEFEAIQDDLLQEKVNWLLEDLQWSTLAALGVHTEVSTIEEFMQALDASAGYGHIPLAAGDSYPMPSGILGINHKGDPYAVMFKSDGGATARELTLDDDDAQIHIQDLPGMAIELKILRRDIVDSSGEYTLQSIHHRATIRLQVTDIAHDFYVINIRLYGMGDIIILGKGGTCAYLGNNKSFDGNLNREFGEVVINTDIIQDIINQKAKDLSGPTQPIDFGHYRDDDGKPVLYLTVDKYRAEAKIHTNKTGLCGLETRVFPSA